MKYFIPVILPLFIFVLFLSVPSRSLAEETEFCKYVRPGIGTAHSRWFFYTPAAVPFGMAKPSPCTDAHLGNASGWQAVGYDGRHETIEGFANFREFQIGGVVLMPVTGNFKTIPGTLDKPDSGYRSRFDKKEEQATPGYYRVRLKDYDTLAELTATARVAFHRYTFPKNQTGTVLFEIGNRQGESGPVVDAAVRLNDQNEIEGFVTTIPVYVRNYQPGASVTMYFVARPDRTPVAVGTFQKEILAKNNTSALGPGSGMYLSFAQGTPSESVDNSVTIKIGMSYTSIDNARFNLDTEAKDLSFDQARQDATATWEDMLGRIAVSGGQETDRIKFYTSLFHALLGRGLASDANGCYPKNNGEMGKIPCYPDGKPQYHHYNTDAMWGTFWNLTQLWALAYPDYYNDFIRCQLDHYRDCGWLPDSTAAAKFVSGVGTNYMGLVVASAYLRGIRDYDHATAFAAVLKNETGWQDRPAGVGKVDLRMFLEKGYVPYIATTKAYSGTEAEGSLFSASHTLEYSFSCFAAANFAKALGKDKEAEMLLGYSEHWKKLYDSETGFIRPRIPNGNFIEPFDPRAPWIGFQEGNAWQYTFYVPHRPQELVALVGKENFGNRLDEIFQHAEKTKFGGGDTVDAFAGIRNYYNHGNQPSLQMAWMFNFAEKPWLTQHWIRRICDVFYGVETVHGYGYGQDEDQGQLGAWYVMAAMGLFDVRGGTSEEPTMQFSAPIFPKIVVQLDQRYHPGSTLEITSDGCDAATPYIQRVQWNKKPLDQYFIPWKDIVTGGTLEFETGKKPKSETMP